MQTAHKAVFTIFFFLRSVDAGDRIALFFLTSRMLNLLGEQQRKLEEKRQQTQLETQRQQEVCKWLAIIFL